MRIEEIRPELAESIKNIALEDTDIKHYNIKSDIYKSKSFILSMPKGIAWKCVGCGMCCKENNVRLGKEHDDNLSYFEKLDAIRYKDNLPFLKVKPDKPTAECIFLDGKRCKVYNMRPISCKIFPFTINPEVPTIENKLVLSIIIQAKVGKEKESICKGYYKGKMDDKVLKNLEKNISKVMKRVFTDAN